MTEAERVRRDADAVVTAFGQKSLGDDPWRGGGDAVFAEGADGRPLDRAAAELAAADLASRSAVAEPGSPDTYVVRIPKPKL